jgi:zinc finger CCHC domain-containing protein 9
MTRHTKMARKTYEEASGFESMAIASIATDSMPFLPSTNEQPTKRSNPDSTEKPEKKHRFKKDKSAPLPPSSAIEDQEGIHPSRRIDHTLIGKHTHDDRNDMDRDSDFEKIPSRDRKLTCFNCRKTGHTLQRCPLLPHSTAKSNPTGEKAKGRVCYICGSSNHAISRCLKEKNPLNPFPFAECFVCSKTGHISGACPENARGVYPKGGSCVHCGTPSS